MFEKILLQFKFPFPLPSSLKKILRMASGLTLLFVTPFILAENLPDKFALDAKYTVCFTPGGNCADAIVTAINQAQQSILIQAYTITSHPIESALINAARKGIDVKTIINKDQYNEFPELLIYLQGQRIPIWIDYSLPGLAHNKVMVIDNATVITGSFNFTYSAQNNNAENLLIIRDSKLAQAYTENWQKRFSQSCNLNASSCKTKIAASLAAKNAKTR